VVAEQNFENMKFFFAVLFIFALLQMPNVLGQLQVDGDEVV
jgi:hypothetical protein